MPRGRRNNPTGRNQYSLSGIKRSFKNLKKRIGNIPITTTTSSGTATAYSNGRKYVTRMPKERTVTRLNGRTDTYRSRK